ncbi:ribonuclease P protein component [Gordonia sp. HNM0687]|uniref:Ribonuclease P protein component n=1 Tax=Gordonia mangrovi TaxID=2665643 RepID=A0A6L7GPV0_9ACTN|nr:ribonuclease P protein component [Gordonia mangrovi]MXP21387.1 ribonuclease P protein component [Gordonia mangrovi]UVF80137.1 ribonuclease P protein component [Gordonia mangrovi]
MVAATHRISRGSDFDRTLKSGVRVTTRDLVIHVLPLDTSLPSDPDDGSAGERTSAERTSARRTSARRTHGERTPGPATVGGPWLGLIVSKAVGNAVIRHRVARRLRAAFADVCDRFPVPETMMVIRARPSSAVLGSPELAVQITEALARRRVRAAFDERVSTRRQARVAP